MMRSLASFYFSPANFHKDMYLQGCQASHDSYVPLSEIVTWKHMSRLTKDPKRLAAALSGCAGLQLSVGVSGAVGVRSAQWPFTAQRLKAQIEYYFSEPAFTKDVYLRSLADAAGFVRLSDIATFKMVSALACHPRLIASALAGSSSLEVSEDQLRVRRKAAGAGAVAATGPAQHGHLEARVRIVSYNLLSTGLVKDHVVAHPSHLSSQYRMELLQAKLRAEVEADSIMCLQEVSLPWMRELTVFFAGLGYQIVCHPYGKPTTMNLGVGVAFPFPRYKMEAAFIERAADVKPKAEVPAGGAAGGADAAVAPASLWHKVRQRDNLLVHVRLRSSEGPVFCVSTYHAPCIYAEADTMRAFCTLAAQAAHSFAEGRPYVLAGDLNIKPGDDAYKALTQGSIEKPLPAEFPGDAWRAIVHPLRSANAVALGAEPSFTTLCKRTDQEFIGTLDYIFLSPGWLVQAVSAVPEALAELKKKGFMPNASEPSDHMLISAVLVLKS